MTDKDAIKLLREYFSEDVVWDIVDAITEKATAELKADVKINQRNLLQKLTRGKE